VDLLNYVKRHVLVVKNVRETGGLVSSVILKLSDGLSRIAIDCCVTCYDHLKSCKWLPNFSGCLVDWLRWGENDVSELRTIRAYCLSPGDCDVDHGMMVSTGDNS
jgi:hypothetical protein